ncbi:hypothetical protein HYX08_04400 [Candidatus Woesearchaeota archaeon]|nr:hypothetical protein [Candidatus Woesearchaeota archaeon]
MNNQRRNLIIALGAIVALGANSVRVSSQEPKSKIHPELEKMLREGNYPRYKGTDLVDVYIKYNSTIGGDDLRQIRELGGQRDEIINQINYIRAGLPLNALDEIVKNGKVAAVLPNIEYVREPFLKK